MLASSVRGRLSLTRLVRVQAGGSNSNSRLAISNNRLRCLATVSEQQQPYPGVNWKIRMLYDGDCPLCMREVNMLRRKDAEKNLIDFVDIASPEYSPADNQNISFEEAMGKIHAITNEGEVVTNIEVFRRLYDLVGLGWVFAITKTQPFGKIVDAVYDVWAKYRLPITGREDLEIIMAKRKGDPTMCK